MIFRRQATLGTFWSMNKLEIISLGAGVQSTTMALMAAHKEITPMPDCAIFADTEAEPKPVYEHLQWLKKILPFPVYTASAGSLKDAALAALKDKNLPGTPPFFTVDNKGRPGRMSRQCTTDFKVMPIRRKIRKLLNKGPNDYIPAKAVRLWIGISADEAVRYKPSRVKYIEHRYPLLEGVDRQDGLWMKRQDCLAWMKKNDYKMPPRSACTFCPNRSNADWKWLKENDPKGFQDAIEFEGDAQTITSDLYLHQKIKPLAEIDFDESSQLNWLNECEGMCGI